MNRCAVGGGALIGASSLLGPWRTLVALAVLAAGVTTAPARAQPTAPIRFNSAFAGGSIGRIEQLGANEYRLHIRGQQDAFGRNHQATWFQVRLDGVAGRELTLRLAGFPGEYNGRPDRRVKEHYRPVVSEDGETWAHVDDGTWDTTTIELTIVLRPRSDALWLAYLHPYPLSRIEELVTEIDRSRHARVETIGASVQGRPLHLVTVTNWETSDAAKRRVWLIARQHAWETGTSWVLEGALRFIASDDPAAARWRDGTIFHFVPTMDPDGCHDGQVRFNAHGYDVNRNWLEVDLRDKRRLRDMPEIWYVKRAIRDQHARTPIDLVVNLHNNDMNEYLETRVDAPGPQQMLHRFFGRLRAETLLDPSRPAITIHPVGAEPASTTNALWTEFGVPVVLLEQRIGPGRELGRRPTIADRQQFGRELVGVMASVVQEAPATP